MSKSLHERLGRAAGIGHIVDDVMAAHFGNRIVKTQFGIIRVQAGAAPCYRCGAARRSARCSRQGSRQPK